MQISKKLTVETKSGKTVTAGVTVHVSFGDESYGRNGPKTRHIKDVDITIPDRCDDNSILSQDEKNEVEKLIGERIDSESWTTNQTGGSNA